MNRAIKVWAHRCGMDVATENSLGAVDRLERDGADGFECDIRLTRNGVPIVFHDADFKRMTGDDGKVSETDWVFAAWLRLPNGEPIPTLEDLFDHVRAKNLHVFLEMKAPTPATVDAIVNAAARTNTPFDRFEALSFARGSQVLREGAKRHPGLRTSLMPMIAVDIGRRASRIGAHSVCVGWTGELEKGFLMATAAMTGLRGGIVKAKRLGLLVNGGVTHQLHEIEYLVKLGVDGIFANDVFMARRALSKLSK